MDSQPNEDLSQAPQRWLNALEHDDRLALALHNLEAHKIPSWAHRRGLTTQSTAELIVESVAVQEWRIDELRTLALMPDFSFWQMLDALDTAEILGKTSLSDVARLAMLEELNGVLIYDDRPDPIAVFSWEATLLLSGAEEFATEIARIRKLAAAFDMDLLELINEAAAERGFDECYGRESAPFIACSTCNRVQRDDQVADWQAGRCADCCLGDAS